MLTLENFQNVPAPDSEEGAVVVEADGTGQCTRLIIIINDKYK